MKCVPGFSLREDACIDTAVSVWWYTTGTETFSSIVLVINQYKRIRVPEFRQYILQKPLLMSERQDTIHKRAFFVLRG